MSNNIKLKIVLSFLLILLLVIFVFNIFKPKTEICIKEVVSPFEFVTEDNNRIKINLETFDSEFSDKNKEYAKRFNLTESEAFIIGNLSKYYAKNLLEGRSCYFENGDILFYKFSYKK